MTVQRKADLMLVLVTLFWGTSYLLCSICLKTMGPFNLNALRFIIAFAVAVIIGFPKLKHISKATLSYGIVMGAVLSLVYMGSNFGVMYTSISNSGFLCGLAVIFTPIFAFIFKKQKPDRKLALVVVVCLVGIGLLTLNNEFRPALGDIFSVGCAVCYAIDLLITETAVAREDVNPFQLSVIQLGFTGLFNLILTLIFEKPQLPSTPEIWAYVLGLAIFCTGLAFIVQVSAQQYTSASHVGVIFTLEPLFSGVAAFLFAGEVLRPRAYFGAFLLVSSLFIMEVDFKKILSRRKEGKELQYEERK